MSEQAYPIKADELHKVPIRRQGLEPKRKKAIDGIIKKIKKEYMVQLSKTQDPRITELCVLRRSAFSHNPYRSYLLGYLSRNVELPEQQLNEIKAEHLKSLENEEKSTEAQRRGRDRFHEILESLLVDYVLICTPEHCDLAVKPLIADCQPTCFLCLLIGFLDAVEDVGGTTRPD